MNLRNNTFFLASFSGILLSLSWPTYGFPLFIFIAFIPLLFAEKKLDQSRKNVKFKVWVMSYWAFFIWNLITTYWLYYASSFGMAFAILVNTLFMSLVFLTYHIIKRRYSQEISLLFLATTWICFEKLHLDWDFSWPWLNLGNVFSEYPQWIQWYEYTGIFGGTLWILTVNLITFYLLLKAKNNTSNTALKNIFSKWVLLISIPILLSLWIYHTYKITGITKEIILLQPNIDPYKEKYNKSNIEVALSLLTQTDEIITPETEYIIAPETVLAENQPFNNFGSSEVRHLLGNYIENHPKVQFLWGIDTYDIIFNSTETIPSSNYIRKNVWVNDYNAAFFINKNSGYQKYLKSKLVVGVENMPYKTILQPLLGSAMINLGGTVSTKTIQKDRNVFNSNDSTKVAPIICYESVYGEFVTGYVKNGAQFLAIITNDSWWNKTQGHKQHLSLARLRGIETRKDIARSANTGISAFINQKGEITKETKYDEKTTLIGEVQLNNKKTFYVKHGDYIARICFYIFIPTLLISFFRKKNRIR